MAWNFYSEMCDTREEPEALVKTDPAIVAGRLTYEVHPWMTGEELFV